MLECGRKGDNEMRRFLLASALCIVGVSSVLAAGLDYSSPTICEDWGFDKLSDQCDGQKTLKCPLDFNKVYCFGEVRCEDGGYYSAIPSNYICETASYEGLACYTNCTPSACGTGVLYSTSEGIAYDSSGKAIALLYNNKYYMPKTFSCGGRTFAEAQQNIADNPQYIMPSASLNSKIGKFSEIGTKSWWTTTTCTGHIAGDNQCYSDDTKLSCTLGLFDCTDTCPYKGTWTSCPERYTCTKEDCSGKYYATGCNTSYYSKHKSDGEEYNCPTGASVQSCAADSNYYNCDTSNLRDFKLIVTHHTPWGSCASSISYAVQVHFIDSSDNVVSRATANIFNRGYTQPQTTEEFDFTAPIANGTYRVVVSGAFTMTPQEQDCHSVTYKYFSTDKYAVVINGQGFENLPNEGATVTVVPSKEANVKVKLYFGMM